MPKTKEQEDRKYGADRKREVINLCLNELISKGLAQTSVRELSAALKLKKAGIYYYFADKDEAIIECAEEAARRLEYNLILPALMDNHNLEQVFIRLVNRANEMTPTMKFFAQVCSDPRYQEKMKPVLNRFSNRKRIYAVQFAEKVGCTESQIEPYFSMCVSAMENYMIFGDNYCVSTAMAKVIEKLRELNDK